MPIYEYHCSTCLKKVTAFVRGFHEPMNLVCTHCGGAGLRRIISSFAFVKSQTSRLEAMGESSIPDESDPRAMAEWAQRLSAETGEDLGPDFEETLGRMERGESPEDSGDGLGDVADEWD